MPTKAQLLEQIEELVQLSNDQQKELKNKQSLIHKLHGQIETRDQVIDRQQDKNIALANKVTNLKNCKFSQYYSTGLPHDIVTAIEAVVSRPITLEDKIRIILSRLELVTARLNLNSNVHDFIITAAIDELKDKAETKVTGEHEVGPEVVNALNSVVRSAESTSDKVWRLTGRIKAVTKALGVDKERNAGQLERAILHLVNSNEQLAQQLKQAEATSLPNLVVERLASVMPDGKFEVRGMVTSLLNKAEHTAHLLTLPANAVSIDISAAIANLKNKSKAPVFNPVLIARVNRLVPNPTNLEGQINAISYRLESVYDYLGLTYGREMPYITLALDQLKAERGPKSCSPEIDQIISLLQTIRDK
jgi:hypothetical protein